MTSRKAKNAVTFSVFSVFLLVFQAARAQASEITDEHSPSHSVGIAVALYHYRFIDDIISPVIYQSSSPFLELFYRNQTDVRRHTVVLAGTFYTSRLRNVDTETDFEVVDSDGGIYTVSPSLRKLHGSHFEIGYEYLRRVYALERGIRGLYLGGSLFFHVDEISAIEHWSSQINWESNITWSADFSLALGGQLEHRSRERDRLLINSFLTVLTMASRPPYYYPVSSTADVYPEKLNYSWMPPTDFVRWSTQVSYELWFNKAIGMTVCYRFLHQCVSEPRELRSISHGASLGGTYAF
jgi:hypothetical protein